MIYSLKERFKKIIKFLTDKVFDRDDRNLYYDVSKDLYTQGIIKDYDMEEIYDDYKYSKEKESKLNF